MQPTTLFLIAAATLALVPGCSKEEDHSDCAVVAQVAQKCLSRSRELSIDQIKADCEKGLADKEMWTWASIDCYRAVGDDCTKWVECIRKDPYKKAPEEINKEKAAEPAASDD
jgi:hypothetical protein